METTTNLGLKKPAETEFYDVNDFNENADKIDAAVSQLETAIAARAMGVYNEGFIGGLNAALLSTGGAAVGAGAKANKGLAGGKNASAAEGAAIGSEASASHGVAAGRHAMTLHGAALGDGAKTVDEEGNPITAVQLGAGTNSDPNTFQVFSYQMMDANGHIPPERLNDAFVEKRVVDIYQPDTDTEGELGSLYYAKNQLISGPGAPEVVADFVKIYFCTAINYDQTEDGSATYTWATPRWEGVKLGADDIYDGSITSAKADFTRYSTTPVQIGEWIDGSPVYRQAFQQEFDGYSVQVFLQNADDRLKVVVLSARCLLRNGTNDTFFWTMYDVGGGGSTSVYVEFAETSKPSGAATAYGYVDYIIESEG